MIYRKLKNYILLLSVLFLVCCSGNGSNSDDDFYLIDKSKLGLEISDQDLGISFYPPKEWILMPASLSQKIEVRSGGINSSENFIYQPVYIFYHKTTSAILSVGKVISNDSTLSKDAKLNYYKSFLSTKYRINQLSLGSFKKSKISFSQFKFRKENLTSIKILFENNRSEILQLDYSIPEQFFDSTDVYIKSSIGSINVLK